MRGSISTILLLSVLFLSSCASLEDLPNLSRVEEVASPLDEFTNIEGYSLRYSRYSSSDMASPILLLHGFMSHIHSWDLLGEALSDSYSLYGYDRMPFGLSQRPLPSKGEEINPYENKQILNRAISFLDYFEIYSTVIIGHSAGGNLALQMVLDYPERVTALILIDPAVYGSPSRFVSWLLKSSLFDRLGLKITRNLAKDPESLFDRAWYDRTKISDELINHYLEPLKVENWDRALYAYTKASVNPKITKRLKEIDIPVLIIHGEEDAVVPLKESVKLNKEISSSVLEVINSCGHAPQEECSQEVIEIILRFLSSIGYE